MTDLSKNINSLLLETKKQPNSEWRNKIISHLKDALACSNMLSGIDTHFERYDAPQSLTNAQTANNYGACSCQIGMLDNNCPIHGTKK